MRIRTSRWCRVGTALTIAVVCVGCALPPQASQMVVGTRMEDGIERPFSSLEELRTAGLANEAMVLVKSNRFFDAERSLRQALYLRPNSEELTFNLAVVLNQVGQSEEAHEMLRKLYVQRPERPAYAVALADTLLTLGRRDEARDLLKGAFRRFKGAQNYQQAARIARSIANVAFEGGKEEEALCYSYEAYALTPNADQLGWHAQLLVAQNLYQSATAIIQGALKENRGLASSAAVQHALALARFAQGDYTGALAAEETALDFISQSPMLGAEINTAWWLMKYKTLTQEDSDDVRERLESMRGEVADFAVAGGVAMTMWPPALRAELASVLSPQVG